MSLAFDEAMIDLGQAAPAKAVVVSPKRAIVIGRERLESMRLGLSPSGTDDAIVHAARHYGAQVTIFCPESKEHGGSWRFAEDLDAQEVDELAQFLLASQLITYRRLIEIGVCMHVRVGMATREQDALRAARDHHLQRLEQLGANPVRTGAHPSEADLDHWILSNFTFFFGMSLRRVVEEVLPKNAKTMLKRLRRVQQLRETLMS